MFDYLLWLTVTAVFLLAVAGWCYLVLGGVCALGRLLGTLVNYFHHHHQHRQVNSQ
jgi:hypothetical protein